jgi:hypothetical protein
MSDDTKTESVYERARKVLEALEWGFERSVIFAALNAGQAAEGYVRDLVEKCRINRERAEAAERERDALKARVAECEALLARRSSKAVELERVAEAHLFPLQPAGRKYKGPAVPSLRIPWIVAEKAYAAYAARYGQDQSLERLAERGGFCVEEMDELLPAWRDECDALRLALARIRELEAALSEKTALLQRVTGWTKLDPPKEG